MSIIHIFLHMKIIAVFLLFLVFVSCGPSPKDFKVEEIKSNCDCLRVRAEIIKNKSLILVNVNLTPEKVASLVNDIGIAFMFAPNFHPAMRYAAPVRKKLGVRTIFNVLGPLANPASATHQVLGVYEASLTETMAEVLSKLGSEHVMVVI